ALALLFVVVAAFVVAAVYALASRLPPEQHTALVQALDDAGGLLLLFAVFLLVGLGFIVEAFFKAYVYAVDKLAEETKVILAANPGHRLATDGTAETARLAGLINALADRHQALRAEVEGRVQEANAKLEEEKHRLAALMSELTDR